MKKLMAILIVAVLACTLGLTLAACNPDASGGADIAILVPNADHGWTGAVLTNAQAWANSDAKGSHTVKVITAADAANQISQIEDIVANRNYKSVVILPYDNSIDGAMRKLANSGIPYIMVDRIIDSAVDKAVGTVKGDNEMIGSKTAERFIAKGLQPGDKILIIPGDLSSVPQMRNKGFKDYLLAHGWTEAQYNASVKELAATGWSRSEGKRLFVDFVNSNADFADYDYIFTHDSEISMGMFEALKESTLTAAQKSAFLDGTVVLAASSGLEESYKVLRGDHPNDYSTQLAGLKDYFDVTYPPQMIKNACDMMVKHLDGTTIAEKNLVIAVEVVDEDNVANYNGFS